MKCRSSEHPRPFVHRAAGQLQHTVGALPSNSLERQCRPQHLLRIVSFRIREDRAELRVRNEDKTAC